MRSDNELILKDRVTLRSFLNETVREDIKILMLNNIIPNINHISDNAGLTCYFIYNDIAKEKQN